MKDTTTQRKCIYCLISKVYGIGRKVRKLSEFNKEHVVHRAVASGYKNAPTLIGRVCTSCNQHFGDSIDQVFSRSGYEGFQRFKLGLKSTTEIHQLQAGGLVFGSPAPRTEGFVPVEVEHHESSDGKLATRVQPYVMLYSRKHGKEMNVSIRDIPNIKRLIQENDLDVTRLTFATNGLAEEEDKLIELLKNQGIDVLYSSSPSVPAPLFISSYAPQEALLRAVAKIAFNYFAYLCEQVDPSVPLGADFDGIRNYIRHGHQFTDIVLSGEGLIKGNSRDHLCSLQYHDEEGHSLTVVHVSLFNGFTYSFVLSRMEIGATFPETQAHRWDTARKTFGRVPLNLLWTTT
ncbi:MAG: hypothetical protein SFY67_05840 [Candidatus Melainabacteria bacterium]|nr:hypothetical protein [Candidatus Melainabacteria bacterium]